MKMEFQIKRIKHLVKYVKILDWSRYVVTQNQQPKARHYLPCFNDFVRIVFLQL